MADRLEGRLASLLHSGIKLFEAFLLRSLHISLLPILIPIRIAQASAPPIFHTFLLLLLIPPLFFLSLSSGFAARRWIPQGWSEVAYLQYGDGVPPYAHIDIPSLSTGQPYEISAHFVVPVSDSNLNLGNFMTTITIFSSTNKTIAQARRASVILPPQRGFTQYVTFASPTTTLEVKLLESFIPNSYAHAHGLHARLEVGRKDFWKDLTGGHGRELTVLEAYVRGRAELRGISAFMDKYKFISLVLTTGLFFVTTTTAAFLLYLYSGPIFYNPKQEEGAALIGTPEQELIDIGEAAAGEGVVLRQRRSSRRLRGDSPGPNR
jgi:hypothetical protein